VNNVKRFECLGTPVRADETRSAAVCRSTSGMERVVIAARGYVLIVDAQSGKCTQIAFPEGHHDYPFASMSSRSGLYYTGAGQMLMILDPFQERFVAWTKPSPEEEIVGFSFAEDEEGHVYAATYPSCQLLRIDGASGACVQVAQLDTGQKYAMSLAASSDGWIYAGIGTTEAGIAAYSLQDGSLFTLRGEEPAVRGSGYVHVGKDGYVYASLPATAGNETKSKLGPTKETTELPQLRWFRMEGGKAIPVPESRVAASSYKGSSYHKLHRDLTEGRCIIGYQLAEGELVIEEADGGRTVISLEYTGNGTALSPLVGGPDGKLYGTSQHPLHLYRYDPANKELVNYGGKLVERGGGGNICAYAAQGPYLIGAVYAGGMLHKLDTNKPLQEESSDLESAQVDRNPRLLFEDVRIHRPRIALAHPDGQHVLVGGFPGYGAVGGALVQLNVYTEAATVYEHEQIVPNQSTISLGVLHNGDVIGGSSIETPGGAAPKANEAVLYRFDWQQRQAVEKWVPIPGAREISLLVVDANDHVHALTSDSQYFVFDPQIGRVIHQQDLSQWGGIVRHGLLLVETPSNEQIIIGLLSKGLFKIKPKLMQPELIAELPKAATSGIAWLDGKIYYGSGSELWSYEWIEGAAEDEL
jgi:hypothetical protein